MKKLVLGLALLATSLISCSNDNEEDSNMGLTQVVVNITSTEQVNPVYHREQMLICMYSEQGVEFTNSEEANVPVQCAARKGANTLIAYEGHHSVLQDMYGNPERVVYPVHRVCWDTDYNGVTNRTPQLYIAKKEVVVDDNTKIYSAELENYTGEVEIEFVNYKDNYNAVATVYNAPVAISFENGEFVTSTVEDVEKQEIGLDIKGSTLAGIGTPLPKVSPVSISFEFREDDKIIGYIVKDNVRFIKGETFKLTIDCSTF